MPTGKPNKKYTSEFKLKVVEQMRADHLSYSETARLYEINDHHRIQQWERIYLEEGPEGLARERRGRGSKGGPGRPPKLDKKVEADLIAEIQQLRMENDYLKKLNALVQEKHLRER
jgi:transposase